MDQSYILTQAKLTLSTHIEESEPENDILILKQVPEKNYLVVEKDQWELLCRFRAPRTLQALVPELITERKAPPLRSMYELVLKAVVSGMLLVDGETQTNQSKVKAVEWRHKLRFGMANWVGVAAILFGFIALLLEPLQVPGNLYEILIGWLLICGCLSTGYFLSACLLVGFDREVYDTHFKWKHPFPHFSCNVEDARMAGRTCEMTVALMQMAPIFFIIGIAALWYQQLQYIVLIGIFYVTLPTGHSPACLLLRSVYRQFPLSTTRDFLFVQNRLFWTLINSKIKFTDKRYLLIFSLFTLIWLSTVLFTNLNTFELNLGELSTQFVHSGAARITAIIVLLIMGVLTLGSLGLLSWIMAKNILSLIDDFSARKKTKSKLYHKLELTTEEISTFFKKTLLLRQLDDTVMAQVAKRVRGLIVEPRKYVVRQGEPGDELFILYEGSVEVLMNLKSGRPLHITELQPGDVFGEIALLHDVPRTRSIRAVRKSLLLRLSRDDFRQLIVSSIGAKVIESIIEKQSFLHRIKLCNHWHPQALTRFAQLAHLAEFRAGEVVIKKGMRNQFFYLIYDGLLEVMIDGKRVAKLATGEFFGEISLLQNSTATADIVAITESRCLVVQRRDFLQFISTDFLVGLQFEDISSKRLKHPIFPLTGVAYDDFSERHG
ncbi:cyclic nucleotide-binding domain-containing protein [Rubellicoccus peritrichatus]|uniref:Cyclic nucleotide-binding domain-containing protein n=1 Tax=Rubellicoccus peritrichatus TaxID=3080537 RepID=A0AAQ3QUU6_9BACT|nr:cyclic nucleotide-binding domain-containing protein [Puniceicoccus sp. CR14]WOO40773.1 cyclic nucleotide-binding domain-containing protein [Puniceicoccus sp. CR14]